MEEYKGYRNRLEMYLSSEKGKRVLNFLYCWGASIVILGALFKLLHLPYANQILFVAMLVESIVFFFSAFERPGKGYEWGATRNNPESIQKPSPAVEPISGMAELTEAMKRHYLAITGHSEDINRNSREYVERMEQLNHNISDLNMVYEMQLRSIDSQIEAIRHINAGLGRIREMYEDSVMDSTVFRSETEKMTRQLADLNQVYARLLQAMTVNMGYQQPYGSRQQPPSSNNPLK